MAKNFHHISISFPLIPRSQAIDEAMNQIGGEGEWIRYSHYCWIVWSDNSASQIYAALKPYLFQTEQILVLGVNDGDRDGLLYKWVWDWMDAKRTSPQISLGQLISGGTYTGSSPGVDVRSVDKAAPSVPGNLRNVNLDKK